MSRRLQNGRWFDVTTPAQHDCLKRFGQLAPPKPNLWSARVQMGAWVGPGRYMLLSYTQRCPRNCCDDSVHEVLTAEEVVAAVREDMQELANVLKEARR
jgi:hypothetical protein